MRGRGPIRPVTAILIVLLSALGAACAHDDASGVVFKLRPGAPAEPLNPDDTLGQPIGSPTPLLPAGLTALRDVYVLETPPEAAEAIADLLRRDPDVLWAEPNRTIRTCSLPNDPYLYTSDSWGQGYDDLWALKRIAAHRAWEVGAGSSGTIVAITDTGIDLNHPDIAANLWRNVDEIPGNGVDDDGNGYVDDVLGYDFVNHDPDPDDDNGHGTHCAGIVAAVGDNGIGIVGVAYGCRVMAVKFLNSQGAGDDASAAQAIVYAADNGARVINMSWGRTGSARVVEEALAYAESRGCVLVAAAGNLGGDVASFYPAGDPHVIAVASVDRNDQRTDFSNFGEEIDLCAPGGESRDTPGPSAAYRSILSLRAAGTDVYGDGLSIVGDRYYRAAGTSMAAPHVAGVAALVVSLEPGLGPGGIRQRLMATATPVDSQNPGFEGMLGAGRVDAARAVGAAGAVELELVGVRVDGREDGRLRSGRMGAIALGVRARGGDIEDLWLRLACPNGDAEVIVSEVLVGHAAEGAVVWASDELTVIPDADLPDGAVVGFSVEALAGEEYVGTFAFGLRTSRYTEIGGVIDSDTLWTAEDSPYLATSSVSVPAGTAVTIEPGVEVRFRKGDGVSVNGVLAARGTEQHPIRFVSHTGDRWQGISFGEGTVVTLEHVRIEDAGSSDGGAISGRGARVDVRQCDIAGADGYAIQADAGTLLSLSALTSDGPGPLVLITGGELAYDTAWTYDTDVFGTMTIPARRRLDWGEGITVRLRADGGIRIAGAFAAQGVDVRPIDSSWRGIHVSDGGTATLAQVRISGGRGPYGGMIECYGGSVDMVGCEVSNGPDVGVLVTSGSVSLRESRIRGHRIGFRVTSGDVNVSGSEISGNRDWGFVCEPGAFAAAEANYWGDPSGPLDESDDRAAGGLYNPTGRGDRVSDGVDYHPFLAAPGGAVEHRIEPGVHMVAAPTVGDDSWGRLSGGRAGGIWIARWITEEGDYAASPDPRVDQVHPGRGYWIRADEAITVSVDGGGRPDGFAIPLSAGWNQIGNPFLDDVPWGDSVVHVSAQGRMMTLAEAAAEGIVEPGCWGYDPNEGYVLIREGITPQEGLRLAAWSGYWIRAFEACELILSRQPGRARGEGQAPEWVARLAVRSASGADVNNYFGVAASGPSALVAETPPGLEGMLDLSFQRDGKRLGAEVLCGGEMTWTAVVSGGAPGETATLYWPELRKCLADGIELSLTDERSGRTIDMLSRGAYHVRMPDDGSAPEFTVRGNRASGVPLMITSLAAGTGRGGSSVPITFNLTRSATVTLDIVSLNGRRVRRVVAGKACPGGIGTIVWDGRDGIGRRMPRGSYICEMIAESSTGQRVRHITTLFMR